MNCRDKDGNNPLHRILREEISTNVDNVRILATQENLSGANSDGYTALHCAIRFPTSNSEFASFSVTARKAYVALLVGLGADINVATLSGKTAVHLAVECFNFYEMQRHSNQSDRADTRGIDTWYQRDVRMLADMLASIIHAGASNTLPNSEVEFILVTPGTISLLAMSTCLHQDDLIKLLISKNVDVDLRFPEHPRMATYSALQFACMQHMDLDLFETLVSLSQNKTSCSDHGNYLLHLMCCLESSASDDQLRFLVGGGFPIDQQQAAVQGVQHKARTPLMLAAKNGLVAHTACLLELGASVASVDTFGWHPLTFAINSGNLLVVKAFTGSCVDWTSTHRVDRGEISFRNCNILHHAVLRNACDIVRHILHNALIDDIDACTATGETAIHLATAFSTPEILEVLLDAGADPEVEAGEAIGDVRAVHIAIQADRAENLKVLLGRGCLLHANRHGMTAELCAIKKGNKDSYRLLQDHIAIHAQNQQDDLVYDSPVIRISDPEPVFGGLTTRFSSRALLHAIRAGNLELCQSLISAGANVNRFTSSCLGCTPLLVALAAKKLAIVRYIVENGGETLGRVCHHSCVGLFAENAGWSHSIIGLTAVQVIASLESESDLLERLLEKDFEGGSPSYNSPLTPLHLAVSNNNYSGVRILLNFAQRHAPRAPPRGQKYYTRHFKKSLTNVFDIDYPTFDNEEHERWLLWHDSQYYKVKRDWSLGDQEDCSALQLAASLPGVGEIVKLLIKYGANVDIRRCIDDATPVILANGANPKFMTIDGQTPLMAAAAAGSMECLISLNNVGVSLNGQNHLGQTVCHIAAGACSKVLSYLFYNDRDLYRKDFDERSAIAKAFTLTDTFPILCSLICNLGLDFNQCSDLIKCFPFLRAKEVSLLLRRLPEELVTSELQLPMHPPRRCSILTDCARAGLTDLIELLIKAGAPLELELGTEGTPLLAACASGRHTTMKILVRSGANLVGTKNGLKLSAITAAILFPDMVRWLLIDRFIDQGKLTYEQASGSDSETRTWSGPRPAEVVIKNMFGFTAGAALITQAIELSALRRNLRGCEVIVRKLVS